MIPSDAELRYDANEQWRAAGADEAAFRRWFVEPAAAQINAAYRAGDIDVERLRAAFDAVLSPIPYRRRFGRKERMAPDDARRFLESIGVTVSDVMLATVAADYGIKIVDPAADDDGDVFDDADAEVSP